jgi:precorrin-6B methylase 2
MSNNIGLNIFKKLKLLSFYSLKKSGYLHDKGWFSSFNSKMPIDKSGQAIPWMTYAFIDFLEPRLKSNMLVFEYGCGNSSLWWQKKVSKVTACESNQAWHDQMKKQSAGNLEIKLRTIENEAFAKSICEDDSEYDIIVIDGADRVNCAKNSLNNLKEDGIIIWDNSDREEYNEGYSHLIKNGFKRLDFYGLGPINVMAWSTSVFYKPNNCLDI